MPTDPRVDEYIAKAPEFAKPILRHVRELIHEACPDASEDIKWSRPAFLHDGKILCGLVAFKAHCSFYIFQAEISSKLQKEGKHIDDSAGSLSKITKLTDLPPRKELLRYIRD